MTATLNATKLCQLFMTARAPVLPSGNVGREFYTLNLARDLGRGGKVVSMLTFYSDTLSLNPTEGYNFSAKIVVEIGKDKQKRARISPCQRVDP